MGDVTRKKKQQGGGEGEGGGGSHRSHARPFAFHSLCYVRDQRHTQAPKGSPHRAPISCAGECSAKRGLKQSDGDGDEDVVDDDDALLILPNRDYMDGHKDKQLLRHRKICLYP